MNRSNVSTKAVVYNNLSVGFLLGYLGVGVLFLDEATINFVPTARWRPFSPSYHNTEAVTPYLTDF